MFVSQAHKDFITQQMQGLAAYDAKRPKGHVYEFHLHSKRVAKTLKSFSQTLGFDEAMAEALYWAMLPHDIGKMAMPVEIWDLPEKPTEEERHERRSHTWRGADIVKSHFGEEVCAQDTFLKLMIDLMLYHHECVDGSGYRGLKSEEMSLEIKLACICDAFDGWTIFRPHFDDRDTSPNAVIERMKTDKAGQFDTQLLLSFQEFMND